MSQAINLPSDCCNPCAETVSVAVPGPSGAAGAAGAAGTDGVDAFTTLTANFTMPSELATDTASVADSTWMSIGQVLYLQNAGWVRVTAKPTGTSVTLRNLEDTASGLYTENVAPATVVASGSQLSPGGLQGPSGASGVSTLNSISPTTTKGDLLVDNGANNPNSSLTRLGVGTDGQMARARAASTTGVEWFTALPNGTATPSDTDNRIARFNAPAGSETPAPLQLSSVLITDDGDIQTVGGNARGTNAVDLQTQRTVASQVASGTRSGIFSGRNNRVTAANSSIAGGSTNLIQDTESFIGGGDTNTVNASISAICGGTANIVNNSGSFIGAGSTNSTTGDLCAIVAGNANSTNALGAFIGAGSNNENNGIQAFIGAGSYAKCDKWGQHSHASGRFSSAGDAQRSHFVVRRETTDATPAELFLDGATAAFRMTIASSTSWTFRGLVVGRRDNGDMASWRFEGSIRNNAGTTALVAAITATLIAADAGAAGTWGQAANVAVTADNTNDALAISVTGAAANNIRWVCHVDTVETTF